MTTSPTDRRRRAQELALAATFVLTAGYEAAEVWLLEGPRHAPPALGALVHALQVTVILAAAWVLLRAWRHKTEHERALAALVEKVIFAQEDERRRIAYELHDGVSPLIVSAGHHVEAARARPSGEAADELARGADRIHRAVVEIRRILRALRPAEIDGVGLAPAVRRCLDEAAAELGWQVTYDDNLGDARLAPVVETAAFRIAQEALRNAARHAGTARMSVRLRRTDDALELQVQDHGAGFDGAPDDARGLGLASMRERARLLGGACEVLRGEDGGTIVRARLPLGAGEAP